MPSKKVKIECPKCKESFLRSTSDIAKATKKTGLWRCKACTLKIRNKSNAYPLYTKVNKDKCVGIKTKDGWMLEHRYVMEQHIGRKLKEQEIVHHVNENRKDNRIENLQLMLHGDHTRLHSTGKKQTLETRKKISDAYKKRYTYEKHPLYKHITVADFKKQYLKYGNVRLVCDALSITRCTFYNKLKHFKLKTEDLCQ